MGVSGIHGRARDALLPGGGAVGPGAGTGTGRVAAPTSQGPAGSRERI